MRALPQNGTRFPEGASHSLLPALAAEAPSWRGRDASRLRVLRDLDSSTSRRDGNTMWYSLSRSAKAKADVPPFLKLVQPV